MQIVLCDINKEMVNAWKKVAPRGCEIVHGSILDQPADAWVSPANSFGHMDGGIDQIYMNHFGDQIQERARRLCSGHLFGEILVGAADLISTGVDVPRYLILAPTMRNPRRLPARTVNPYLATRAAIYLADRQFEFNRVVFPGMGCGIGGVPFDEVARQMKAAIEYQKFYEERE